MEVGDPGEVKYLTYPCKEILVFTCNFGDAERGPKCNHSVAKHAHK